MKLAVTLIALVIGLVLGAYCIDPIEWKKDFR